MRSFSVKIRSSLFVCLFVIISYQNFVESEKQIPESSLLTDDVCFHKGSECQLAPNDCCSGLNCDFTDNKCTECRKFTESCQLNQIDCCKGYFCDSSTMECNCLKPGTFCLPNPDYCCSGFSCISGYCCIGIGESCQQNPDYCCNGTHCDTETLKCKKDCIHPGMPCQTNPDTCCKGYSCDPKSLLCCGKEGYSCAASPYGCCGGLKCVGFEGEWSCQSNTPPTPPPTPPPSPGCRWKNEYCGTFYGDCCSGLTCTNEGKCESSPNLRPDPPCIQEGLNCEVGGTPCCSGLKCSYSYIWSRSTTCN